MAKSRPDAERRENQRDRLAKILDMMHRLLGLAKWTPKTLAADLGISEATVYRYLQVLRLIGVHAEFDRDYGGYRVTSRQRIPVLGFTQDELFGQGVATVVADAPGMGIGAPAKNATSRIAAAHSEEKKKTLADAQRLVHVLDLKLSDHSKHADAIWTIQRALIEEKQLGGEYESPYQEKTTKLRLHPFRLVLVRQAWYLVARPSNESFPKTYRVHRFKSLRLLDSPSVVPENFDLRKFFGNAWGVYRGVTSYDVELRFAKDAAAVVTETNWHPTQKVKRHSSGEVTLTFTVDGLEEIVWWILGWAGRVTVVRPEELRKLVLEKLQQAIEINGGEAHKK